MSFNFETSVDRTGIGNMKGTFSSQAGGEKERIILAGAEMDYQTAPVICGAASRLAERGLFGYTLPDTQYQDTVAAWMKSARGLACEPDEIVPTLGTIFGLCTAIRAFTDVDDGVIIQHPSYFRFDEAIRKVGRRVVSNPLIEEDCTYHLDFDDLEEKMRDKRNKMMVLCNPHNPTGKVFTEDELKRLASLAKAYGTIIFSDEIFAEVTYGDHVAVPYVKIDPEHAVTSTSLGKVFSMTGVNHANMLIKSTGLRERYLKQRTADHFGSIDPFFYAALTAGYSKEGWDWVQEMKAQVWGNYQYIRQVLEHQIPEIRVSPLEGTYVAWMDFRKLRLSEKELQEFLVNKVNVLGDPGNEYGPGGSGFYRFNIATPRRNIAAFMENLRTACKPAFQGNQ